MWKREPQVLVDELGIEITWPDTSKWNKIQHRIFAFIAQNWLAVRLYSNCYYAARERAVMPKGFVRFGANVSNRSPAF